LIADFRKQRREQTLIHINGTALEKVTRFKFLCVHITEDLSWTKNTTTLGKRANQRLYISETVSIYKPSDC
jgi:hypothetical protein